MASLKAKRLRIGFLVDDGVVRVQPPIARAIHEVVTALKAAGHEGIYHWNTSHIGFSDN
jgi:amidase